MGNDGGTIAKRSELVNEHDASNDKRPVTDYKDLFLNCALTGQPLQDPIVSDYLGRLYNKEAILEWLLKPKSFKPAQRQLVEHIQSARDVVTLVRSFKDKKWVCELSGKDVVDECMATKFVYQAICGHVMSASALEATDKDDCPICKAPGAPLSIVPINPKQDDMLPTLIRYDRLVETGLSHSMAPAIKAKRRRERAEGSKAKPKSKRGRTSYIYFKSDLL